jgi:hypothetical protein
LAWPLFQVLQIDHKTREVFLQYLKKEMGEFYSATAETSWEPITVVTSIKETPQLDPAMSRRKLMYKF